MFGPYTTCFGVYAAFQGFDNKAVCDANLYPILMQSLGVYDRLE